MHEREVHTSTVHTDSGGGVASGMILGIILVLLALAVAAFLFFGNGLNFGGGTTTTPQGGDTNIQINPPAPKVDVNVNPGTGGTGGTGGTAPAPNKP